jgi:putative endonuclease
MEGFTDKYNLEDLVYFENYDRVEDAIAREKQIKKHRREKKDALVESMNPDWRDLYDGISR